MPAKKRRKVDAETNSSIAAPKSQQAETTSRKERNKEGSDKEKTKSLPGVQRKVNSRSIKSADKARNANSGVYWLMKSEPETRIEKGVDVKFGIEDLMREPNMTACWDGVRNYQARNFMRDQMVKGQLAFFYHSNCKEPGIAGIMEIVKEGYPDHTQFDKKDIHFDSSSKKEDPRWFMVDVHYKRHMKRFIPLSELKALHLEHKANGGPLANVALFTRARLSVQPLTKDEWDYILTLEDKEPED